MDALALFLLRYDAIHGGFVDDLFAGLTDAQVRQRPHGLNSVVWLVWHATRVEDAAVSRFVADRPRRSRKATGATGSGSSGAMSALA